MIRWLAIFVALAACTPPRTDTVYSTDGQKIDIAYLVLSPLCVLFCATTVSTQGSDSDVVGDGSTTNTQSSAQTVSATGG